MSREIECVVPIYVCPNEYKWRSLQQQYVVYVSKNNWRNLQQYVCVKKEMKETYNKSKKKATTTICMCQKRNEEAYNNNMYESMSRVPNHFSKGHCQKAAVKYTFESCIFSFYIVTKTSYMACKRFPANTWSVLPMYVSHAASLY